MQKRTMISACAGDVAMMLVVFADRVAVLLGMINTVPGPIMLVVNPIRYVSYSREINPSSMDGILPNSRSSMFFHLGNAKIYLVKLHFISATFKHI